MAARIVKLNVGGIQYTTTEATLSRAPFFEALLRNELTMQHLKDGDGCLFIDRNGAAFKDVLEFLRTGQPVVPSVPAHALYVEADFYQLQGFQLVCEGEPAKQIYLPEERVRRERLQALYSEFAGRRGLRKRFVFAHEQLPVEIQMATHTGRRGAKGCLYEEQLAALGFRPCVVPALKPNMQHNLGSLGSLAIALAEPAKQGLCFERIIRTAWVDLQRFDVIPGMWDLVDISEDAHVAQVTSFE